MDNQLLPDRGVIITADAAEVYALLNSSPDGLTRAGARERLAAFGPNVVAVSRPYPLWRLALDQITSPIIYVLLVAALITLVLHDYSDTGIILAVVVLNGIIGFFQEYKATRAMEALRELASATAQVRRGGRVYTIPAEELAPGDVVLLEAGMRVPADVRLTRCLSLLVDESQLTGESVPVNKQAEKLSSAKTSLVDMLNVVFAGSMITEGRGEGVVIATGRRSELGKIAQSVAAIDTTDTPLQRRLRRFATSLAYAMLLLVLVTIAFGVLRGLPLVQVFLAAVALAVSVMPEGLPVVVTVALSLGVRQMAARNVLVRRLPAAETMGSVDIICTDKTGTLTQNHMTVQMIAWGPYAIEVRPQAPLSCPRVRVIAETTCPTDEAVVMPSVREVLRLAVDCNSAEYYVDEQGEVVRAGSPTELALLEVAAALAPDLLHQREALPPSSEVPFSSARKFMAIVQAEGEGWAMYVKGAPEVVLPLCSRQWSPLTGEDEPLDGPRWLRAAGAMAAEGQRVLAVARREWPQETIRETDAQDLTLYGLFGIADPPRPDALEAMRGCRRSGLRAIMVTGDHPATATAIARAVGLIDTGHHLAEGEGEQAVLTGEQLAEMDDEALGKHLQTVAVLARVTPQDKLRVVELLQRQGRVVAVTGDGVNDAPALRRADIGVAMGQKGTEAAREAADVVLLDDSFASIYEAVKVGRFLFENIRKVVFFLLSSGAGEVVTILGALALGFPLPFTAAQILWINLVTNGLQDVALAFEPGEDFVVRRRPHGLQSPLYDRILTRYTVMVGLLFGLGTLAIFYLSLYDDSFLPRAQTAAVTTMVMFQLFHALNCRSLVTSVFRLRPFSNPFLAASLVAAATAQVLFVYWAPMRSLFQTVPLAGGDWPLITGIALLGVLAMELAKLIVRRRRLYRD